MMIPIPLAISREIHFRLIPIKYIVAYYTQEFSIINL